MKIIILSAGKGSRLMPFTENTPKPLMDLGNGKTILETQIDNIIKSGAIDEIVLTVGYKGEQIEAKIKKYQNEGIKIKTVFNPFYDVSCDLISLWLAKHEMNEDFIVTNGDNIFEPEIFSELVAKNREGVFLTTIRQDKFYKDDMKAIVKNGIVTRVSKEIEETDTGSVGLVLVSGEKSHKIFKENMEELARDEKYLNKHWLEIFNRMSDKGIPVFPFEIEPRKWKEIDLHTDLLALIDIIKRDNENNGNFR